METLPKKSRYVPENEASRASPLQSSARSVPDPAVSIREKLGQIEAIARRQGDS